VKDHVCSDFDGNFGVLQSSKNCEDSWPYGSCVVDGGWTRLGSGTAVGNLQDYKLGARQQRLGLSLPGDTERLGRSAPLDQYTIPQQGFCVKSNGWDQNSGVIKLDSNGGHSEARHKECWAKCKASGEAVKSGCELIWNQSNQGCYLHTKTIDHGNGVQNHKCWIFPTAAKGAPAPTPQGNAEVKELMEKLKGQDELLKLLREEIAAIKTVTNEMETTTETEKQMTQERLTNLVIDFTIRMQESQKTTTSEKTKTTTKSKTSGRRLETERLKALEEGLEKSSIF